MTDPLLGVVPLGAEFVPPESIWAQLAAPLGILVFFGSTYLLLRSNLGTKRGYLVLATVFFGFVSLFSLFWTYGGMGSDEASGPRQLPGQPIGELEPGWVPFAQDARLVDERAELEVVRDHPEGFEVVEGADGDEILDEIEGMVDEETFDLIDESVGDLRNFFADEEVFSDGLGALDEEAGISELGDLDEPVEIGWTEVEGTLIVAITYAEFDEEEFELVDDGYTYTAFGFYDEGALQLPGLAMGALAFVLFVLHAWLLDRDERLERRQQEELTELEEPERVPVGA